MGAAMDFLRANKAVWKAISVNPPERVTWLLKSYSRHYDLQVSLFRAAAATAKELTAKNHAVVHLGKAALLGLHAVMFHDEQLANKLLDLDTTSEERFLAEVLGMDVDLLRECMYECFYSAVHGVRETWKHGKSRAMDRPLADICEAYWKHGVLLHHVGSLLASQQLSGTARSICSNALVPWVLSIIRDLSTGSVGAGSIAVFGASIGRGKTTTIFYTLRSVLLALDPTMSVEEAERVASGLIILDPEDFFDVITELAEREEKAALMVVDNASAVFPKQWFKMSGDAHKLFINANTIIDMLRAVSGATIFVANAPGEIASFVRNAATLNVSGREADLKTYSVTVYTWKRPTLRVRGKEEEVRMKEKIASVYAYPLLKLSDELYKKDLEVKAKIVARKAREVKQIAKKNKEEKEK